MEHMKGFDEFVDKCTARRIFEKAGVGLYEQALKKCPERLRARLEEIRDEEKSHEEMLDEVIRKYGGDPYAITPSAKRTITESEGIEKVVKDEDFPAIMDALLAAELVDNASWELLIELADRIDDEDVKEQFEDALDEEADHLDFIKEQVMLGSLAKFEEEAA